MGTLASTFDTEVTAQTTGRHAAISAADAAPIRSLAALGVI